MAPRGRATGLALLRPQDTGAPADRVGQLTGMSLVADDVTRTSEELSAKGVKFDGPPQGVPWGALATWFSDPDGNNYFLTEDGGAETV